MHSNATDSPPSTPSLCACYKCLISGRSWNLTIGDIVRNCPLVQVSGRVTTLDDLFTGNAPATHAATTTTTTTTTASAALTSTASTLVAFYFGTCATCEICRDFSCDLVAVQEQLEMDFGFRLHVVYVSCDQDASQMLRFMKTRPHWYGLRFDDDACDELRSFLSLRSLPSLVVLDSGCNVLSRSGRADLVRLGTLGAWKKWVAARPRRSAASPQHAFGHRSPHSGTSFSRGSPLGGALIRVQTPAWSSLAQRRAATAAMAAAATAHARRSRSSLDDE